MEEEEEDECERDGAIRYVKRKLFFFPLLTCVASADSSIAVAILGSALLSGVYSTQTFAISFAMKTKRRPFFRRSSSRFSLFWSLLL